MTELTYEELRRIQSREREPGLSKIPEDFYERIPEVLTKYSKARSASEQREYENVLKIIRYIYTRREEKILLAALNNLKGIEPPGVMLKEELESYKTFSELLKSNKEKFERKIHSFSPEPSTRSGAEVSREAATSIKEEMREIKEELKSSSLNCPVRIVKDVDEFVGLDGSTYGPYVHGAEIVLPMKEIEMLVKMKLVERIGAEMA